MEHRMVEKIEHTLTLKVMRLTKPTLSSPIIITNEIKDLPEDILNNELRKDITSVHESETLAVGQFLLTPQSFGNIYLGESFLGYIFVHNDSSHVAKNVQVKADLQTSARRISLSEHNMTELSPQSAIDQVINHEVKEIGTHILVCEVSYLSNTGDPLSFRKFFRFEVTKPLDLKTKFYNAESDEVFLEAQVQNKTAGAIHLEKVSFETSHLFRVSSLNSKSVVKPGDGLLQPEECRQYLYCLSPVYGRGHTNILEATNIGRLDISWRYNLGEKGRLQTSQLQRIAPDFGDIRLSVHNLPNIVQLDEPFNFACKISNLSKRAMDLVLNLEKLYSDLIWIGISGRHIGRLEIGGSKIIELTLVPLSAGLHNISGIRLKDLFSSGTYDYDDVAQVFVT
ncbi:hypothetical protein RUM44_005690 [Polyplax serrata]|uniref:Trafficking protein particle complex subunit 13 n=1 Tax=Polyplax serrata TaxID=468196 RepID=A0ABR1AWA3_POLSC